MQQLTIEALVPEADADAIFTTLCEFERYPELTASVKEVAVRVADDGSLESSWSVYFRNGILCWFERDVIDHAARSIEFEQIDGDFDVFEGSWEVVQAGDDVIARFSAAFDLGMPSLAPIIDPIAERTLRENIELILRGLTGSRAVFLDAAPAEPAESAVQGAC